MSIHITGGPHGRQADGPTRAQPGDEGEDLSPLERVLARFDALGLAYQEVEGSPGQYAAQCPVHRGRKLNFSITEKEDGTVLLWCQAYGERDDHANPDPNACTPSNILHTLGLKFSQLFGDGARSRSRRRRSDFTPGWEPPDPEDEDLPRPAHAGDRGSGWTHVAERYEALILPSERKRLATHLGVSSRALKALNVGWNDEENAFTFPERNHRGRVIGINCRYRDGVKKALAGSMRGLYLPDRWRLWVIEATDELLYIPEGASDVAALLSQGYDAIGRPSCRGGLRLLGKLLLAYRPLVRRPIVIVADNEEHVQTRDGAPVLDPNGEPRILRPGHAGAEMIAAHLRHWLPEKDISWVPAPAGYKDVRNYFNQIK